MIAALGFLAAALSISTTWPQVWRSCRQRRTRGLSPTGSWLAVALNLCWLTFGLLIDDPVQVVTHAVVGVGNAAVLVALLVSQPRLLTRPALLRTASGSCGLGVLAAGSLAAATLGATPSAVAGTFGAVITLVGMVAALPQLLGILLDRTQDLSGMSSARWYLGAVSSALWVGYGWQLGQPTMWLSAGFGLVCAVVTCAVLRTRRAAQPADRPRVRVRPPGARLVLRPAPA